MSDRHHAAMGDGRSHHGFLIDNWAQALWEADPAGVVVTDSPSWRAYTGQTLDEWLGYGWLDAIHPDDRAYAERQWREAMAARALVNAEFRLHAPDGGWRWTNVRAAPVFDGEGTIEKWVGMNIDIDDRKRAEAALRASEERYRTIFDSIDEGFCIIEVILDAQGQPYDLLHLEANAAYERNTGLTGVVGKRAREIVPDGGPWLDFYGDVARTGEPARLEIYMPPGVDRWISSYACRFGGEGSRQVAVVFNDITDRKRAEAALRETQERQAYLLKLSDALQPLDDPLAIQNAAMRVLADHLGASGGQYGEAEADGVHIRLVAASARPPDPFAAGRIPLDAIGTALAIAVRAGETVVVTDIAADPRVTDTARRSYRAWGVGAYVAVPRLRDGRFTVCIGVHSVGARDWTRLDIGLIEETAERTFTAVERARAEAALRESEERFAHFGRASSDDLWIRDAATLALEYASDAMETIYGISREAMVADPLAWPALIVPEDRDETLGYIERVRAGESVVHEFRIQRPSDLQFRWVRSVGFPLFDNGNAITRIAGISSDITDERLLAEHQGVLLAELQHRVRNIMAIIRSIVVRTAPTAGSAETYVDLLSGRLLTLARVQALLTRAADAKVSIATIVRDELAAQAMHAGQFDIDGPDIVLSPKAAETMTLAVHELTTNALKHGALSAENGKVTARWTVVERGGAFWLSFDWSERGAPIRDAGSGSRRTGFGSELIEGRVPYELGGHGALVIEAEGARCHIAFPLKDGPSVLETEAPRRATLFGGAIDMTGQADLGGQRVLVVEDDYYLASDAARALRGCGAEVVGPCPSETAAREEHGETPASCAILDINLNGGRSFGLARELKRDGVPFVFITGYDQDVIPDDLADVRRLQKPIQFHEIIGALVGALEER